MKKFFLAAVICVLAPFARADDAAKHAKVKELFTLTSMQNRSEQAKAAAISQAKSFLTQQLAVLDLPTPDANDAASYYKKLYALIDEQCDWKKLEPAYEQIYVDLYSEEELDGILEFYKSPAGKAFLTKVPEATRQTLEVSKSRFEALGPQLQQVTSEYLAQLKARYESKEKP